VSGAAITTSHATSTATASVSAFPTDSLNATLACQVYQSYSALCPQVVVKPTTSTVSLLNVLNTITIDASSASSLAETTRASCLCYSASYFVPAAYDQAAWACAAFTDKAALASTASDAAETQNLCSNVGDVRHAFKTATFNQYPAATAASTTPATASKTAAPSKAAADRAFGADGGAWVGAAAVAVVAALV
jgi:hypothetical protein